MSLVFIPAMCLPFACFIDCSVPNGSYDIKTYDFSLGVFCCIEHRKGPPGKAESFHYRILFVFSSPFCTKYKRLKSFGCCLSHKESVFRGNPSWQDTCNLISIAFVRRKQFSFPKIQFWQALLCKWFASQSLYL